MTARQPRTGRPTARESARLTAHIIEAGWRVVLAVGPEQFSIDRLAAEAHVSKQTIYARFSGKLELLRAVQAASIDTVVAQMRWLGEGSDIQAVFADLAHRVAVAFTEPEVRMIDRLIDWIEDAADTDGPPFANRIAIRGHMHRAISERLEAATARWPIAIDDVPFAATFWIDVLYGHTRSFPDERDQREAWARRFTEHFLRAVCRLREKD